LTEREQGLVERGVALGNTTRRALSEIAADVVSESSTAAALVVAYEKNAERIENNMKDFEELRTMNKETNERLDKIERNQEIIIKHAEADMEDRKKLMSIGLIKDVVIISAGFAVGLAGLTYVYKNLSSNNSVSSIITNTTDNLSQEPMAYAAQIATRNTENILGVIPFKNCESVVDLTLLPIKK